MSTFSIPELSTLGLKRKFEPPPVKPIGCYSKDADGNFTDAAANLKFIQLFDGTKSVLYNLNDGLSVEKFEEYDRKCIPKRNEQNSRLVHLLQWINEHQEQFEKNRPDFVLLRGVMREIVLTPYRCRLNEKWRVGAMRKNGTIYIRKILTKEQLQPTPSNFQASTWGYNFHKFVLSNEPNEEPNTHKDQDEKPGDECHVVLQINIGGHEILYSAVIDAVAAKEGFDLSESNPKVNLESLKNCHRIKVKTCVTTQHVDQAGFRKFKSRSWWVVSALGGISNIIVGYKDNVGMVKKLENMPVKDLYEKYGTGWYGESGYQFFEDFLDQVKHRVVEDETVYIFSFGQHGQSGTDFQVQVEVPDEGSEYLLENLV